MYEQRCETEADFSARADAGRREAYWGAYRAYTKALADAGVMVGGAGLPTLIAGAIPPGSHPRANMLDALVYSLSTVLGPIVAGLEGLLSDQPLAYLRRVCEAPARGPGEAPGIDRPARTMGSRT